MLSAALDIIKHQEGDLPARRSVYQDKSPTVLYEADFNCTRLGTAGVLLADIIPSMMIKFVAPFFVHRMHFHVKIVLSCLLALNSFIMVSYSPSMAVSLLGIVSTSLACGLGDVSFLSMTAFFHKNCVSAWSSGTGAAGLFGAIVYASLAKWMGPEKALLLLTVVPIGMLFVYFLLLDRPAHPKFRVHFNLDFWPFNSRSVILHRVSSTLSEPSLFYTIVSSDDEISIHNDFLRTSETDQLLPQQSGSISSVSSTSIGADRNSVARENDVDLQQLHPDWRTKLFIIRKMLPLMFFLVSVYFFEYLINQSLFELIHFPGTISYEEQYRWYQVLYQTGVFISRSSVNVIQLKWTWLMSILQAINFVLCLTQVLFRYIPNMWIMFVIILYEGCLGGLAYVNTFFRIIQETAPAYREYAMTAATISDSIGITAAGFVAIPLRNWICYRIGA